MSTIAGNTAVTSTTTVGLKAYGFWKFWNATLFKALGVEGNIQPGKGDRRFKDDAWASTPYYDLLKAFQRRTGVPVLVNTSFNTRGEPIVCTPRDAVESFWTSPLDALVIGSFVLEKARSCCSRSSPSSFRPIGVRPCWIAA